MGPFRRFRSRKLNRRAGASERATGAVEYALLIAVLAVPTAGAADYVGNNAKSLFETASAGIEDQGGLALEGSTTTTTPDGGTTTTAPTTTTTAAPTTTTTSPPTTTTTAPSTTTTTSPPTTTTTAPSTTTTAAPTTTAPPSAGATFSDPTTHRHRGNRYWSARTTLSLRDAGGVAVPGAEVTITIRYLNDNRWNSEFWTEETVTVTTGLGGSINVSSDVVRRRGFTVVTYIEFVVTDVQADGMDWDGNATSVGVSST